MEGTLVDVLPIDVHMESVRPMFTERKESHNVTSGKTAISSYLDSEDCSSNHKTEVLRNGNSSTSNSWFKIWSKKSSQKLETYLNFEEDMAHHFWRSWFTSKTTISVPESKLFTLQSKTSPRRNSFSRPCWSKLGQ